MVKVVLCDRCCKKLMWKRNKDKVQNDAAGRSSGKCAPVERANGDIKMHNAMIQGVLKFWAASFPMQEI